MTYLIEWKKKSVIVTFKDDTNRLEINKADGLLLGDSRFDNKEDTIYDFSKVNNFNVDDSEVKIIAELDKGMSHYNRKMKFGIISVDKKITELASEYKELMRNTSWSIKIFDNLNDALKWCQE